MNIEPSAVKDYFSIILIILSSICGGGLSFLLVSKVRVPMIEQKIKDLGESIDGLKKKFDGLDTSQFVKKEELYYNDGGLVYMGQRDCEKFRDKCTRNNDTAVSEIDRKLDLLIETMKDNRTLQISFMTAVKEKMNMKFVVPPK